MLPTKFQFIWPSGFRGEDFLDIETALPKRTEIWWEAPIGYGSFCIKFPQSRMKGERHRLKLCQSQSRRFLEIDQSEKRIVCGDHVC
jgi:hypothetical protein